MASLDSLLHHMGVQGAIGAFLRGNTPIQLQSAQGIQNLGVVSNFQLERDIREIIPFEAQSQLDSNNAASFSYSGAQFMVQNLNGLWQLQIAFPMAVAPMGQFDTEPNTSGEGQNATFPPQLRGWNWGGFFLPWIWSIGNKSYLGLLALVPIIGFFVRFWVGVKGNEWSWRNRRWNSIADFRSAQSAWAIVGCLLFVGGNVLGVTVMFPVFARARENARRSVCQSNLKQIGLATFQYALAHGERLPTGKTPGEWQAQIAPYLSQSVNTTNLYHCPSDQDVSDSYQINPRLAGMKLEDIPDPAEHPLMWDRDVIEHFDSRNVLFADGHVKAIHDSVLRGQIMAFSHD